MKKKNTLLSISVFLLFVSSCGTDPENEDNNNLSGDTDIALGEVGNTGYTVIGMNGDYTRLDGIEITENDNGIVNIHINTDISNISGLDNMSDLVSSIYPGFQSEDGKLVTDLKYKITSDGIQDYNNVDGKAHTLVKYDSNVGDTYTVNLANGNTLTRKVTAKSTEDDFQWGFYYIKTITVEQNAIAPGISKYRFRANHKFGLVFVEAIMEDGTSTEMYVYPSNY